MLEHLEDVIFFLHDGRTTDLVEAIRAHRSEGNSKFGPSEANKVIDKFNRLDEHEKQDLLNFLRSLQPDRDGTERRRGRTLAAVPGPLAAQVARRVPPYASLGPIGAIDTVPGRGISSSPSEC